MHATVIRKIPYPYTAMLAVCSDLDLTPDKDAYLEVMRFLNTEEDTHMGRGVGLEVGNTIYFDMPAGQFSYWNTDDTGRACVRDLIRSGHIDCLHSFGDLATRRSHAGRALEDLERHGCKLQTWVDHAVAPTNFGPDIMQGRGDVPGDEAYHADLTCGYGIRFVWIGRTASVIGQDASRSLRGIYHRRYCRDSLKTIAKEAMKGILGRYVGGKYAMHGANAVLRPARLRDGRSVFEFMRFNPFWQGVNRGETADGIADVLVPRVLDRLIKREGIGILYTHLGKTRGPNLLSERSVAAFRLLAQYAREKKILVTTTKRLLAYCAAVKQAAVSLEQQDGCTVLDVKADCSPEDGGGLTVYVPSPGKAKVLFNGQEINSIINPPDRTGRRSVSMARSDLEFPL